MRMAGERREAFRVSGVAFSSLEPGFDATLKRGPAVAEAAAGSGKSSHTGLYCVHGEAGVPSAGVPVER